MTQNTVELNEGTMLAGRYNIEKVIGAGGFGTTYKAYDKNEKRLCAIKEFMPKGIVIRLDDGKTIVPVSSSKNQLFEHGKDRFLEEAEILQRLNKVRAVVSVYDFFQENGTCYFVMEFLEGVTLGSLTKQKGGKLPYNIVANVVEKVGKALIQVHNYNIFHRDISPDNIFVTTQGEIKLIDFGNAKNLIRNDGENLSVVLKPGFAPPEQYSSSGKQGTFTDVYSLASISPEKATQMCQRIYLELCALYPNYQGQFTVNFTELLTKLNALQAYGESELSNLKNRHLITFHDGFSYFAESFDLHILKAVEEESGSEASAEELKELILLVQEHHLPAIFTEENGSVSAASVIAAQANIESYALNMGMADKGYFETMYHNIDTIKEALG